MTDWREGFRRFAGLQPVQWIDPKVLRFLESVPAGCPVVAGCSGGADSVFLALTLLAYFNGAGDRLVLAHFNHGLRGAAADGDEAFVRDLAAGLGIAFDVGRPVSPLAPDEATLRSARYSWLLQVRAARNAAALALGHQADDVVESLLLGVLTGAGPAGLSSPQPVKRFADGHTRLRPLLAVARETIVSTLAGLNLPWREDDSNRDTGYTRNWLRHEILPRLRERMPQDIHAAARRSRQLMEECTEALDAQVRALQIDLSDPVGFDASGLDAAPAALVRRILTAWWLRHRPDEPLGRGKADELVAAIPLAGGWFRPVPATPCREAAPWGAGCHWAWQGGPLFLPDGARLAGRPVECAGDAAPWKAADPAREAWLAGVGSPLLVRQWRPGDRYQPLGAPGRRKLQDLFTDAKVAAALRQRLPVVCAPDGEILWVPCFPPADAFRICQPDKSALQLTYYSL